MCREVVEKYTHIAGLFICDTCMKNSERDKNER